MIHQQYKSLLILFTLLCFSTVYGQSKVSLNISGNIKYDKETYTNWITSSNLKSEQIISTLEKELKSRGYYNFQIIKCSVDTLISSNKITITLKLDEGKQSIIRKIYFQNYEKRDSNFLHKNFNFLENQIFQEFELENKINSVLENFENKGYPFINVIINSIKFLEDEDNNSIVDIYLKVEKEKHWKFDQVEILGNTKTKENVILNAITLKKGENYSQKRLETIPTYLNRLRFFENVDVPKYYINSMDEGILQINIIEKNTNLFDGILGYVPSNKKGESGYLTGFANISLRNLFGTGRGIGIKWKQESSLTQELELKYLEPWILDYPFNLNFYFLQRKQDSSYVKRNLGGDVEFLATENITASFIVESESVISSINNTNQTVQSSFALNSGLKFKIDYRDDVKSPQSGIYFSSLYKYSSKTLDASESLIDLEVSLDQKYHNYELDFEAYYSQFQNQVLAFNIHAKELIGNYYSLSDYFQLGGTKSVRGYRENQFLGNRIIWSNLEYRFLLSSASFLFLFYDSGYFLINKNNVGNIKRKSDYMNGYGLGISLDTALGILKVSYAFSEGVPISEGLIHFGLVNDF